MQLLKEDNAEVLLGLDREGYRCVHLFDAKSRLAVNAALVLGQPLLVTGEPGVGKSQLARAAATALGRRLVTHTISARTEVQDLFWTLDAVRRLSEAQLLSAVYSVEAAALRSGPAEGGTGPRAVVAESEAHLDRVRTELEESKFVDPGPLWFAFNWGSACTQYNTFHRRPHPSSEGSPGEEASGEPRAVVVLLDEIDKGDAAVPNGLLEALGERRFPGPPGCGSIEQQEPPPLVVITTNGERELPNAFLRRCVILALTIPEEEEEAISFLVERGREHFKTMPDGRERIEPGLLEKAAEVLWKDRQARAHPPRPGQGEYLSLVKAVCELAPRDHQERLRLLKDVRPLTTGKFSAQREVGSDG